MTASFAEFEQEFIQYTGEIVWCTFTTVGPNGRPRSRVLHPIWQVIDGKPTGYVVTGKTPIKVTHLAANPYVACSYWGPSQHVVYADCVARWVEEDAEKQHVWDLFMTTPPPLGYDLRGFGIEGATSPVFTPMRLDPWRIQMMNGREFYAGNFGLRMWRSDEDAQG